jgi:DMSO/TMAO reductase YedYZ molybdopterin-dependent catalytic subunit
MFFGVYQQLQQQNPTGASTLLSPESALLDWPASFSSPWQSFTQTPTVQWSLELGGDVQDAKQVTYVELSTLPITYQVKRLASKHGWAFKAEWHGITVQQLLNQVSPQGDINFLEVEDLNGQTAVFPLASLLKNQALLVLHQGTQPLSPWHGGPLRFMAFDYVAEYNLGQVKALRFLKTISKEAKAFSDAQLVPAGKYYCYDLKELKDNPKAGELKGF